MSLRLMGVALCNDLKAPPVTMVTISARVRAMVRSPTPRSPARLI